MKWLILVFLSNVKRQRKLYHFCSNTAMNSYMVSLALVLSLYLAVNYSATK